MSIDPRYNVGVAGVSMAALDSISDENTRVVLRSIVDGWNVRNGHTGNGDSSFVTRGELGSTQGARLIGGLSGNYQNPAEQNPRFNGSDINRIITGLQTSVLNSPLFRELGERIRLIDTSIIAEQTARIAAVQQVANDLVAEATTRLGFDNTHGSAINSLQSVTSTHATLISGLTTRVDGAESTIINLQSTTASQATSLTNLNTRVGTAESNITSLQTTTSGQATTLSSLNTRVGSAESNISTLNTTTSNQANSLSVLTTTVGNKAKVFYQATAPTSTSNYTLAVNDLWLDSDDGNRAYRWTGSSWAETSDTRIADVAAAVTYEATTRANADNAISSTMATQFTTVNGNISALQTAQTTITNNVASLSSSLTTLQATVGSNTSAIQSEATARVNADNDMYAKFSVKIDQNGYVSGFGLMSTANNSTPYSEFIVRADRFAIGSPSGPGINPVVPFIVTTTTDSHGNPPGVYMDMALIKYAGITTGYIADASVDTLRIAGNAVTQPVVVVANSYQTVSTNDSSSWTSVASITVDMGPDVVGTMSLLIQFSYLPVNSSGGSWQSNYRLVSAAGTTLFSGFSGVPNNAASGLAASFGLVSAVANYNTFYLQVRNEGDINGSSGVQDVRLMALGAKR